VRLGDVRETVDEAESLRESGGSLLFEIAVQCGEQFHGLSDRVRTLA